MSYTKDQVLEFQDLICWKGHVTWIGPFLFLGEGIVKCQNIPWLEFFHFQLLQISMCPDLHLLVENLDIYFSQTYILWRCKALGKIPLVYNL